MSAENARLKGWKLVATKDGNEITLSGRIFSSETETFVTEVAQACALGLRTEGFEVEVSLEYEAVVNV